MREVSAVMVATAAGVLCLVLVMAINAVVIGARAMLERRRGPAVFRPELRDAERHRRLRIVRAEDAVPE